MEKLHIDAKKRHDFLFLFDVQDGNPNGDPDAGNLPRIDPETMQGLVTDVCIKRKIRNYVDIAKSTEEKFKIYIENRGVLNNQHQRAYTALGIKSTGTKQKAEEVDQTRAWMCENFYDVRTFGAVMTTGVNCGQVRGAMQLTFARSVDTIIPMEASITRIAVTKPEDAAVVTSDDGETSGKTTEMGRKAFVPYGLYKGHGFYNASLAKQTGFDNEDLALFWEALEMGFEGDRSASRGMMSARHIIIFTHEKELGNAPAHKLFDLVHIQKKTDVAVPRRFDDYIVTLPDAEALPNGITMTVL